MMRGLFLFILMFLLSSCAVTSIQPGQGRDFDLDLSKVDMRHGWKSLLPPERTIIGVNDKNSIDRGRKLFMNYCTQCHGEDGASIGPLAKAKGLNPKNLKNLSRRIGNSYLVLKINNGQGDMPEWKDVLTTQQSWDLTNYIQTLRD